MPLAPLPTPRGPHTEWLLAALERAPHDVGTPPASDDPQLPLHVRYEHHHRGLAGVDERWEVARRHDLAPGAPVRAA